MPKHVNHMVVGSK